MSAFLQFDRLSKRFGALTVLDRLALEIEEGETLVLLGPSGSGKTTLLRLLAGFEVPDGGAIRLEGRDVTRLPPERRNFGMVFQHYALFPHLSVAENVAFGLESRRVPKADRERRVAEVLDLVDLGGFESRRIHQISGGQQQRVALARALAPEPRVLLLDEPLSNLDPALRERTRHELRGAIRRVGITAVWVTHEQEEAFDVGDRVAVLHQGVLEQLGTPETLYLEPRSPFVARFVGRASTLRGRWRDGEVELDLHAPDGEPVLWRGVAAEDLEEGDPVEIFFRPEGLELGATEGPRALRGRVHDRRYSGSTTLYLVELSPELTLEVEGAYDVAGEGDRVAVSPRAGGVSARVFRQREDDRR
jgi:ABC-type Fe3+/spermidine/putrescine transport system ATPase subunit